jgi:acetyl esterase/lipase
VNFHAAVLLLTGLAQTQYQDLLHLKVPPPDQRISYGADALEFCELRLPAGRGPFPVAIIIHGGCWSAELPGLPAAATSLDLTRPMAEELRRMGIATWNVEFRRFGNPGGGWPGSYQDLSHAADLLRDLAPKYQLDLSRVIAMGHSSGGQLALWLAARHKLPKTSEIYTPNPLDLAGVVDLDGPPDLAAFRYIERSVCGIPAVTKFIGGAPSQFPERYAQGGASKLLPLGIPQELFSLGRAGQDWTDISIAYERAAKQAGDRAHLTVLSTATHFDWLNPESQPWKQVANSISALLALNAQTAR